MEKKKILSKKIRRQTEINNAGSRDSKGIRMTPVNDYAGKK